MRYSGKERDTTGLYYYGYRYYAPWLQRWINPDPAGYVDGMNLFAMVRNRPVNYGDLTGHAGKELTQKDLDRIASTIKKDMEGLSEEDVVDVINQYLTVKGADPQQYLETIKSLLGFTTTKALAGTSTQPPATKYHRSLKETEKKGFIYFGAPMLVPGTSMQLPEIITRERQPKNQHL